MADLDSSDRISSKETFARLGYSSDIAGSKIYPLNPNTLQPSELRSISLLEQSESNVELSKKKDTPISGKCMCFRSQRRRSERSVPQMLFGERGDGRRFSADLHRYSDRSLDRIARRWPARCTHNNEQIETVSQKIQRNGAKLNETEDKNGVNFSLETDFEQETTRVIFFQVFIPFLVAGFGNVAVGLLLAFVQHWTVFRQLHGLMMLTSSFLGFKGNLEMSLAARLSTKANCGQMDKTKTQWKIGYSNVALVQVQSIGVALLVAILSASSSAAAHHYMSIPCVLTLVATSLVSASTSSLLLSSLMVMVVILAHKTSVNPDNVSTLISACLGDVTSVAFIAYGASLFYANNSLPIPIIAVILLVLLPFFVFLAATSEHTNRVLCSGWMHLLLAMFISSASGFIFAASERMFTHVAVFQPILNGTGSNLVAVQVSRISTYLHQRAELGTLRLDTNASISKKQWLKECLLRPHSAFIGSNPNVKTARLLLLMVVPAHLTYLGAIFLIKRQMQITLIFVLLFLLAALLQVSLLLFISHLVVPLLWIFRIDPDSSAIPVIMSCADLLGTCLLLCTFHLLHLFNQPIAL